MRQLCSHTNWVSLWQLSHQTGRNVTACFRLALRFSRPSFRPAQPVFSLTPPTSTSSRWTPVRPAGKLLISLPTPPLPLRHRRNDYHESLGPIRRTRKTPKWTSRTSKGGGAAGSAPRHSSATPPPPRAKGGWVRIRLTSRGPTCRAVSLRFPCVRSLIPHCSGGDSGFRPSYRGGAIPHFLLTRLCARVACAYPSLRLTMPLMTVAPAVHGLQLLAGPVEGVRPCWRFGDPTPSSCGSCVACVPVSGTDRVICWSCGTCFATPSCVVPRPCAHFGEGSAFLRSLTLWSKGVPYNVPAVHAIADSDRSVDVFLDMVGPECSRSIMQLLTPWPLALVAEVCVELCKWLSGIAPVLHSLPPSDRRRLRVTPPIYVGGRAVWFWDLPDFPQKLQQSNFDYAPCRGSGPASGLLLRYQSPPPTALLWVSFCPTCGAIEVESACVVFHEAHAVTPACCCVNAMPGRSQLTMDVAARSHVCMPGVPVRRAVPATGRRPHGVCYWPDHSLLMPRPQWPTGPCLKYPSPLNLRQSIGLRFVLWNLGGVGGKVEWLCSLIVALEVDIFGLQEDRNHAELRLDLPPQFHVSYSATEVMGTGFVIGCRRSRLACRGVSQGVGTQLGDAVFRH